MCEDRTHYFIHSGSSAKDHNQAGLLTIISKRVVDKGSRRFISAIDGRLMHVQFKHAQQIQAVPLRSRLMIGGDCNCNSPCTVTLAHSGPHILPKPDHGIQDADYFNALVQRLDLVVLNTFSSSPCTYIPMESAEVANRLLADKAASGRRT